MTKEDILPDGNYVGTDGRVYLRSGMPELSYTDDFRTAETEPVDDSGVEAWIIYFLCAGLLVLGLII